MRHNRAVKEKEAAKRVLKHIHIKPLRAMVTNSFYFSKATYALPLIATMSKLAMEEWNKLQRVTLKHTYALNEKTGNERLY